MTPEQIRERGRRAAEARWGRRLFRFCSWCEDSLTLDWKGRLCLRCRREKNRLQKERSRKRPEIREKYRLASAAYYAANREVVCALVRKRYWRRKLEGAAS